MTVRVLGIRHHGPGSARAVAATLADWRPGAVLIEGPPEAAPVLDLAGSPAMRPPVALLGYSPAHPRQAAFFPMASWSPEWVALRWALAAGAAVSMIDLPVGASLGAGGGGDRSALPGDPIARLAEAAGYDDTERWWEDVVEHRFGEQPWDALTEAMAELRADAEWATDASLAGRDPFEARREAAMRQHIRAAQRAHERVAVVCGAWHAPALVQAGPARPDRELLAGMERRKAAVTWVPWTSGRLRYAGGYGAGVSSPGWYEHLYTSPDRPVERWMVRVSTLLRAEQADAPPASVVDAVRLAEALASMRGRPLAGLGECDDAARAVLTGGRDELLALIGRRLVVGEDVGRVPPETPMVALAADLAALQRRLRLKPAAVVKALELDLRRDVDLQRSRLLHRLDLLDVRWGVLDEEQRGSGTFREAWTLGWAPELAVRVIEASVYGTTVEAAAAARTAERIAGAPDLASVTGLAGRALLADLPGAVRAAMAALDRRAARSSDVGELMAAVVPLARVLRYGTVRRTDADAVEAVVRGLVRRVCVGLAPACASLDDDAAEAMTGRVTEVSAVLASLDDGELRGLWLDALARVSATPAQHGLVAGRCSRLLLDAGRIDGGEVARRLSAALSPGTDPGRAAAWIEGLVEGSALLLVYDRVLMAIVDAWLASVEVSRFDDLVPLLRRSFGAFESGERRLLAEAAARLDGSGAPPGGRAGGDGPGPGPAGPGGLGDEVDAVRAAAVVPLLRLLLGDRVGADPESGSGDGPGDGPGDDPAGGPGEAG